jgi:dTDP-glucose pyrophosphorylase
MEIDEAIILIAGKATRLEEDPFLKLIPAKGFFPLSRIPEEETIIWRIIRVVKELGIRQVYIITNEEAKSKVVDYIELKQQRENIGIKIEVVPQNFMETGNRVVGLKERIKGNFLICYGDEVFDGNINKEFKSFIEKSKEITEKDDRVALIRALVKPENYKGGIATLKEQTKCKVKGNRIIWATKNEFLPRDKEEVLLFTSFMVATPKISEAIKNFQKETGKEQVSLHDLEFTNFLIKKGMLDGIVVQLDYFNINREEDKKLLYEHFTIKDFEKLKNKTYSTTQ